MKTKSFDTSSEAFDWGMNRVSKNKWVINTLDGSIPEEEALAEVRSSGAEIRFLLKAPGRSFVILYHFWSR